MIRIDLGATAQERDQSVLISIICLTIGILSADIIIPLGFVIWILYLVPLLMSVWLSHRYAPFFIAWLLSGCTPPREPDLGCGTGKSQPTSRTGQSSSS